MQLTNSATTELGRTGKAGKKSHFWESCHYKKACMSPYMSKKCNKNRMLGRTDFDVIDILSKKVPLTCPKYGKNS